MNDKVLQKKRCKQLFGRIGIAILIGLVYAVFVIQTGLYMPCPFRLYTGLRCPGCGISHLCTALLQFRWKEAFWYNPVLFVTLPVLLILGIQIGLQYVRRGTVRLSKKQNVVICALLAILVIFGIVRNVIGV